MKRLTTGELEEMIRFKIEYSVSWYRGFAECYLSAKSEEQAKEIFHSTHTDCKIEKIETV